MVVYQIPYVHHHPRSSRASHPTALFGVPQTPTQNSIQASEANTTVSVPATSPQELSVHFGLAPLLPLLAWVLVIVGWIVLPSMKKKRIHQRNIGQPQVALNVVEGILRVNSMLCLLPFTLLRFIGYLFVGRCYYCGRLGHHKYACPKKEQCWNCEETGHHSHQCPYPQR